MGLGPLIRLVGRSPDNRSFHSLSGTNAYRHARDHKRWHARLGQRMGRLEDPMIVGVTFGCIAGTLLVVGGILFYLRRRRIRARRAPAVIASNPFPIQMDRTDSDARARCDDLERQLRALQEQVDRLEGQQVQLSYGGGAGVLYTNEKDEEGLGEKKRKSDGAPPTYGD
ncbi:hypothetical protein B0H11DRAFT_1034098 [Mycena galericulata]|nr:hypothetical protein B0H11DRAFT_1034098 [Mycena galericulata]